MAIKSQMRLIQLTGSVVDYKPTAVATGLSAAAFAAGDLSGSFRYIAQALTNIHGSLEFGAQTPGLFSAADGNNYDLVLDQNDTGQKILLDSAGEGADAVDINATAGGVDIDCAKAFDVTTTTAAGDITLTSVHTAGVAFQVNANTNAASEMELNAGILDINVTGAANIDSVGMDINAGDGTLELTCTGTTDVNAGVLDIDSTGALTMDSASTMVLGAADDSSISVAANGKDLTIGVSGGGTQVLQLNSAGTGGDAIDINASGGGIDIDSTGNIDILSGAALSIDAVLDSNLTVTANGQDLTVAVAGGGAQVLKLDSAGTGTDAIDINATAGGIDIDAQLAVSIESTAGGITIGGALADQQTLQVGKAGAVELLMTAHDTPADEKIFLINTAGTADDAIKIDSVAGGLLLAAGNDSLHIDADGTDADALNIDSAGGMDVDVAGVLNMLAADDSVIAVGTAAKDLALTVSGGGAQVLQLNSAGTGTDAIDINATAGGVDVDAAGSIGLLGGADSSYLVADDFTLFLGEGIDNAQHTMISITHDSGTVTNEKILIQNNAGTTGDAVKVYGKAGGIWLDSDAALNDAINIDSAGGVDIDAAGTIAIDGQVLDFGATDDSNITVAANAKDLIVAVSGGGAQKLQLQSAGTGTDALFLGASAGGIDVDVALGFDLDAGGAVALDSTAASITVGAALADDQTLKLGKNGAVEMVFTPSATPANEKFSLTNTAGTAGDAVLLEAAGAGGGVQLMVADEGTVSMGKPGHLEMMISPSATAGNEKFSVVNGGGNARDACKVSAPGGGVVLSGSIAVDLSGSVVFSADGQQEPMAGGNMMFAQMNDFVEFRSKSIFSRNTTVVAALNACADAAGASEPTLFGLILSADINADNDVTVAKTAGETGSLLKTVGEQNARVYVNGQLMKSSSGGVTNDYVIQDTNDLRFQFQLKAGDVVQVMDYSV